MDQIKGLWQALEGFTTTLAAAAVGRLMWHVGQVRKGTRCFWSLELVWELPVAFGMALIGAGVAEWAALPPKAEVGLIAALSYLGPRGIESLLARWGATQRTEDRDQGSEGLSRPLWRATSASSVLIPDA